MEKKDNHFVSKELARDQAITRVLLGILTKASGIEGWKGSMVNPKPLEIFDMNGQLLFYEFSVEKNRGVVGRVKVSANKVLGPAVYTAEIGRRLWDAEKATERAKQLALKRFRGARILSTKLVCYSYPKLGISVALVDPETKEGNVIVMDVATYQAVPFGTEMDSHLGIGVWSLYDSIPLKERADRVLRWEEDNRLTEFLKEQARKAKIDLRTKLSNLELKALEEALGKLRGQGFLGQESIRGTQYQRFKRYIWPLPKTISLTLHGQEGPVWCAVASGQMIFRHHHYNYEQDDIAVAMGTIPPAPSPPPFFPTGTTYGGFMSGMETLSRNYLDAIRDYFPTWASTKSEIDEDRPLMSSIPGHARVCAGYHRIRFAMYSPETQTITLRTLSSVYIYDPWPPNANNAFCSPQGGAEYWEDWDATTYRSFVYLRPCAGTMICQE
jgi:hypothetical protein